MGGFVDLFTRGRIFHGALTNHHVIAPADDAPEFVQVVESNSWKRWPQAIDNCDRVLYKGSFGIEKHISFEDHGVNMSRNACQKWAAIYHRGMSRIVNHVLSERNG